MRAITIKNLLIKQMTNSVSKKIKSISEDKKGKTTVAPVQTVAIMKIFKPLISLRFLALGKNGKTYNKVKTPSMIIKRIVCNLKQKREIKTGNKENKDKPMIN